MKQKLALIHGDYHWDSYSVVRLLLDGLQAHYDVTTVKPTAEGVEQAKEYPIIVVADVGARGRYQLPNVPLAPESIVVGVSFACPVSFNLKRLNCSDLYCTTSPEIAKKYPEKAFYMPPYSSHKYFKPMDVPKEYDCVFAGWGRHIRVPLRKVIIAKLREAGLRILVVGRMWLKHEDNYDFVEGEDLVRAFNSARFSLDITTAVSPISSRLFQAALCGLPSITLDRESIRQMFRDDEILFYDSVDTTVDDICRHVKTADAEAIGQRAMVRTLAEHTAECRAGKLAERISQLQAAREGAQ